MTQELATLYAALVQAWHDLPIGAAGRVLVKALVTGLAVFVIVHAVERWYGVREDYYFMSRGFAHDLAYWFYYRTRLDALLYYAAIVSVLDRPLSFLDLQLAASLPVALQALLALLITDLTLYWIHRAQHRFRFLWAFHTTHHSDPQMTVFTGARFHPVDTLVMMLSVYVPTRALGGSPEMAAGLGTAMWFFNMLIHSRIPWGYGPLHRVLVSPGFHAFHHSSEPVHHDRNFSSGIFSFWDYLFGTAVRPHEPAPARFGLSNVTPTSLWSTLAAPFRLLAEFYLPPFGRKQPGPR